MPTDEQAALLSYRALCRELYGLAASEMQLPLLRAMDKGLPLEEQRFIQEWTGARGVGVSASVKDLEDAKVAYDDAIRSADYTAARWVAIFFDRVPDILCSGSAVPDVDFTGRRLQDLLDLSRNADHIGLSLLPTDNGGAAVLSWLPHNPVAEAFARSLIALQPDLVPHALVRFCFDIFENMYFAPRWWEPLPGSAKRALIARFNTSNMLHHPPNPGHLMDDGIRAVDWRVVSIQDHSAD